jgi:hypothetical protein
LFHSASAVVYTGKHPANPDIGTRKKGQILSANKMSHSTMTTDTDARL